MQVTNTQPRAYSLTTRLLIACGAIGPLLFILVFLVAGAVRPGYSAWHNFVSDLGECSQGWIQIANFLICGLLVICFPDRQWRGWALYSLVSGILLIVFFIACLVVAVLDEHGTLPNSPTRLLERIAIIIGWIWIALLALRLLRQMKPRAAIDTRKQ